MNKISKISVITPCYNAEDLIRETIESVIYQTAIISGRVELEYIICDGHSTDKTLEIIEKYRSQISSIKVISEPDNGMYEALSKGLGKAAGDICAYINAGDFYYRQAFDVVLDIMENKNVYWLTGLNVTYNEKSQLISMTLPFKYRRKFIKAGLYNRKTLPHIEQESTFWRKEMISQLDFKQLSKFRYAGDYYIWSCFSDIVDLNIVYSFLGGFKKHKGQLSFYRDQYIKEKRQIIKPNIFLKLLALLERPLWYFPPSIKKMFNKKYIYIYDVEGYLWR